MTLYFISGLGADERVFQRLQLPRHWTIRHIAWLPPLPHEPLAAYCQRMAQAIDTGEDFALIGLSFGGIVATGLTRIVHPRITILLSSVSTRHELPAAFRVIGKLRLNRLIPAFLLNRIYPFTYWYFGVTKKEDKKLLRQIIRDTSPRFLQWAIDEIVNWKNEARPRNIFHIHGTADHIFPVKNVQADRKIRKGGHLMVYTMAEDVSHAIVDILQARL